VTEDAGDHAWLDARERGESVDHVDAATRTRYANLERHLAALPDLDPPRGWQDRVIARLDRDEPAARRRFPAWWLAGGVAAATVAIAIAMRSGGAGEPFELAIERENRAYRSSGDLLIHDRLRVHAASRLAAVRIYTASGRLLAGCPDGPGCAGGDIVIDLVTPDSLAIVGLAGCRPPPTGDDAAADVVAATAAGCSVVRHEPLHVR
jgi:hypothetical protein